MGGHFWADPDGHVQNAAAGTEFDLVISLITRTGHGPDPGVHHLISEIPDSPLTAEQLHSVQQLAHHRRTGRPHHAYRHSVRVVTNRKRVAGY